MAFPLLGSPKPTFSNSSGAPLTSGTLSILDPADDTNKASYPTYDDAEAATNANDNPITLDSRGEPPDGLFGLDGEDYKLVLKDSFGTTIWTTDDVFVPVQVNQVTSEESAASVTPTDPSYPPGDVRRYGAILDGVTDDTAAAVNWINVGLQGVALTHPGGTALLSSWAVISAATDLRIRGKVDAVLKATASDTFIKPTGGDIDIEGIEFDTWASVVKNEDTDTGTTSSLRLIGNRFLNIAAGVIDHERPLERAWINQNYFNTIVGHCIRIGRNVYAEQDNWQRFQIKQNVAINISQIATLDVSFCITYGIWGDISHNYVENVDTDSGECWGIYTKCRYANVESNRLQDFVSVSGPIYAINIKGSSRGVTTSPQGYAVEVKDNKLLQVTADGVGVRIQNEDTASLGNTVEGFTVGMQSESGASYKNNKFADNTVICPNTTAGTYGINLIGQIDGLICTDNAIESGESGIRIAAATSACGQWQVDGNVIRNSTNGILSNSTVLITDISISNNTISGTTSNGIFVQFMDKLKMFDNQISPASGAEIDFSGSNVVTGYSLRHRTELQTTDATTTTVLAVQLADNSALQARMRAIAMESDGSDRALYGVGGLFYRDGGAATQQGATYDQFTAIESDATWTGATFGVSTNDLVYRVAGVAAQTINWAVQMECDSV